jgi:hypothetical protein
MRYDMLKIVTRNGNALRMRVVDIRSVERSTRA